MTLREGVTYFRFRVTFRTSDRRRRRWVRWSPGAPWIFDEVSRELEATFTRAELPAGTNVYVEVM